MRNHVELITTGSELLSGRTVNRHAQVLGDALFPLGLQLTRDTTVPDDAEAIDEALRSALSRVDLVVVTGGLGPTSDDLTRDVAAKIAGKTIVMDEPARQAVLKRYEKTGRKMNPFVERHALVVEGADVLQNSAGLAPGERISVQGKTLFLLPGPPREFAAVLSDHVLPWLKENAAQAAPHIRIFEVCGIGESDIISRLEPAGFPLGGTEVAYCAAPGRVEIRLSGAGEGLDASARMVSEKLGDFVYAEERIDLAAVIGRLLTSRKATLATAESCTGGLVGHRLTGVSGSSAYYLGGVIAYSNDEKIRDLGVNVVDLERNGAVSEIVARQMAAGVRAHFDAEFGLSVTGIAGPAGATSDKPVGLVYIAVADREHAWVREHRFAGGRDHIKEWSAQMALDLLRRRLLEVI